MGKFVFLCHFVRDCSRHNEDHSKNQEHHVDITAARRYKTTNSAVHFELEAPVSCSDIPASRSARQQRNAIITAELR